MGNNHIGFCATSVDWKRDPFGEYMNAPCTSFNTNSSEGRGSIQRFRDRACAEQSHTFDRRAASCIFWYILLSLRLDHVNISAVYRILR